MKRKRKRMALYEVISKNPPKSSYSSGLEEIHPSADSNKQQTELDSTDQMSPIAGWPKRPKMAQFNAGRIEISMPYQLAIALLLGVILLILVVFRLGQVTTVPDQTKALSNVGTQKAVGQTKVITPKKVTTASTGTTPLATQKANNRIVIQTYLLRSHLEPVRLYFAQFGIVTEILKVENWYYLVTKEKYQNPEKVGTEGYFAKQKIIDLGMKYKAPSGYETFGKRPFHDAYGKKFDK